ncbi:MAG: NYN domain-containing protein [Chloroflexi bacterium]|nr:NYN domain-containing protein [Chloroflexota bacterium]
MRRYVRTNVYFDAFNLYYGCLKDSPYRWLGLAKLCQPEFPSNAINRIRYFTARLESRPDDLHKPERQQSYLRALQTIPNLSIHYGHYLSKAVRMPLANLPVAGPRTVEVLKMEEKGSDVNLATHLVFDAFDGDFTVAIIVSNDSDLVEPIRMVRARFGLQIGVLNPHRNTSHALRKGASFYRPLRRGVLSASQFPDTLSDDHGTITKPSAW